VLFRSSWGPAEALAHVVPEDRPIFTRAFDTALATGQFHYELRIVAADDTHRWLEADGEVIRDEHGKPVRMRGTVVDISERKRMEEALRQSERLHRTIAHHFPRGTVGLFDRQHRLLVLDGAMPVLTTTPQSLVGLRPSQFVPASLVGPVEALFADALAGRRAQAQFHVLERIVDVRVYPVLDEKGEVSLGLVMTEDVTEQTATRAKLAVSSRLTALATLVAGLAHEINNPLSIAASNQAWVLQLVRELRAAPERWNRAALDDVIAALEDAEVGSQRIARVVRELSTLGRLDIKPARTRLSTIITNALSVLDPVIRAAQPIAVDDPGGVEVMAAPGQLERVFVHLLTNAAQAARPGGADEVRIAVAPAGAASVRVEVVDHGVGIEPTLCERIFEPFFTTRTIGQGLGLGLTVSHAIITAHHGSLTCRSVAGEGSTFAIELPIADGRELQTSGG
jgi:signal transduction histidine kinase